MRSFYIKFTDFFIFYHSNVVTSLSDENEYRFVYEKTAVSMGVKTVFGGVDQEDNRILTW